MPSYRRADDRPRMARRWIPAAICLALLLAGDAGPAARSFGRIREAGSTVAVNLSFFYDELAPYGSWVDIRPYGWCWAPRGVSADWRPYTEGSWAYTDCGWTWVSYEPWGWAVFHYGRWLNDPHAGWVWVPGTVWGPAWVAWRWSDDWVGWAALSPGPEWSPWGGFRFASVERPPARDWCFVRLPALTARDLGEEILPVAVNVRLSEPEAVADIPIDHFDGFDKFDDLPRDGKCVRD